MEIFAIWTTDDERRGSIKAYCKTRKKAEEELKKYRDFWCNVPPLPDDKHIIPIQVIEDEEVLSKKRYLVATAVGGLMETPDITYKDYDIIEATSPEESVKKYNKKHNCNYFYGHCIGEVNKETITVPIKHFISKK